MKQTNYLTLSTSLFSFQSYDQKKRAALTLWLLIAIFCVVQSVITNRYNNYLIFENTVRNLLHQNSLYAGYPLYHFDANHYGPLFSVFFMPFAMFPNPVGFFFWNLFNVIVLYKAIQTIPTENKLLIYFIALPCIASATLSQQFNPAASAFIILSYTQLNKHKGLWSTMLIVLGTFIKLYGVIGLAFFFFVKDKKRFVLYLIGWSILFFVLPMLFSSPSFVIHSYKEWMNSLIHKNELNILESNLDISIMGFVRSLFSSHNISNVVFLGIGVFLFGLPYLNIKNYSNQKFQLYILGSALMFPVLFSTGAEDCTYIIAIPAVGIWYVLSSKKRWKSLLLWITIVFSCNFPLLLFPRIADKYQVLLTMLSLPFFIVWLFIIYEACAINKQEVSLVETT